MDLTKEYSEVNDVMESAENNAQAYMSVVTPVVDAYSKPLDDIMKNIYTDVIQCPDPAITTLEKYFLELSNCVYFMCSKLEQLGSYDYISKSLYKEAYNQAYLDSQVSTSELKEKKKTVNELVALSEESAKAQAVTSDIYSRAYKIVKTKIDAAQMMISTLSKTISRRMTEFQLQSTTPSGKQYLNE